MYTYKYKYSHNCTYLQMITYKLQMLRDMIWLLGNLPTQAPTKHNHQHVSCRKIILPPAALNKILNCHASHLWKPIFSHKCAHAYPFTQTHAHAFSHIHMVTKTDIHYNAYDHIPRKHSSSFMKWLNSQHIFNRFVSQINCILISNLRQYAIHHTIMPHEKP